MPAISNVFLANRQRWSRILRTYGLTREGWIKILEDQDGRCAICTRKLKLRGKNTRSTANTDHCHTSGKVRGILCRRCNMDIVPFFESNLEAAGNLYNYLTKEEHYGIVPGHKSPQKNINSSDN